MTEPLHLHNCLTSFFFTPQVLENWGWGSPHIHNHPTIWLTGDYRTKRKKEKLPVDKLFSNTSKVG